MAETGSMSQESSAKIISSSSSEEYAWENPRLTKDVIPETYKLFIYPSIKLGIIDGQVLIDIKVSNYTKHILVHQTNLTIETTKLITKTDVPQDIPIEKTWSYPKNDYWVIQLENEISPGSYELQMKYKGTLSTSTLGLYKSTYKNSDNEECTCVLSYFEATYARSAFPCFDEPSFRAKFHIKIAHEDNGRLVALSNSCREKETPNYPSPGVKTVHFKPTPPVPPYLVAIIIGDFSYTEPVMTKGNVSVAIYSRAEIVQHMKVAQSLAVKVLDFFTAYFDIPYSLPKLDLIALPDSNIGGMENWGMITFREDCLLLNENSTCEELHLVTSIIAHEISHMWFGDLVTIAWWDNLWLKEGFATFMSCIAGAEVFPEWYNDWTQIRYSRKALQMDAPFGSHPLVQTVNTTAEIRSVFDAISYNKGHCLIRMLRDLDPDGFQAGIRSYLKRYKFTSTITQNLWDEVQEKVDFDVTHFMNTWTDQMGFPVLHVQFTSGSRICVSQSRFLQNKHSSFDASTSPFMYKWIVPIKYVTSNSLRIPKLIWLNKDQDSVALESERCSWVKLNWHQVGFYRVNYPSDLWDIFSLQLIKNPLVFDVEDRANLIDDAFNLACSGYFHYNIPLNLLRYLRFGKEKHFFPWSMAAPYLHYIGERFVGTEGHPDFIEFVHTLLKKNLTNDIWNFEEDLPYLQKKFQLEIIKLACWSEEPNSLQKVKEMFTEWHTNKVLTHPELRSVVYTYGLASDATDEVWNEVLNYTLNEVTDPNESLKLWQALGSVKNKDNLKRLIELAKDENNLKSQDFFIVLNTIGRYPLGLQIVWDFIRNEWEYLVEKFTLLNPYFGECVHLICSQFGTEERLKETKDFFAKYPEAGAGVRLRQMALEKIKINIDWYKRNQTDILLWLKTSNSDDWFDKKLENSVIS